MTAPPRSTEETPNDIAARWLDSFQTSCSQVSSTPTSESAIQSVLALFHRDGWWRDKLCLSWDFHTREGIEQIRQSLLQDEALAKTGFKECRIDASTGIGGPTLNKEPSATGDLLDIITFMFRFNTTKPAGSGRGIVKLTPHKEPTGEWRAFVLFTGLETLDGHMEDDSRPFGHYENHTRSWDSVHDLQLQQAVQDPTVLVVGGAQAGLLTAARLHKLGLRVLVIEKTPRIGDVWRNRYDMLTLHTTNAMTQMPFQPYPQSMPEFIPRTKFADYLEYFSIFQEIPCLTSAEMLPNPSYDPATKKWTVKVNRAGEEIIIRPEHLIMATGGLAEPKMPSLMGLEKFKGKVFHSDAHKNANGWKGKKVVIVGAGVTGTDIALEADHNGADVLIVQRSPITMIRISNVRHNLDHVYPPDRPTEDSDWLLEATPINLFFRLSNSVLVPMAEEKEKELHEGLRAKGFLLGWGEEMGRGRIGHIGLVYTKFGGFCVDVGCADRIVDGRIKLKPRVEIEKLDADKVIFTDGTSAEADILVLATGYYPMSHTMMKLLGPNILSKEPKIWNVDEEGEFNGIFRQTDHPGLWYAAGGFSDSRSLSKWLALRILAEKLGVLEK